MKSEVIQTLHALIHESLFGTRPWFADREITSALTKKLNTLGLNEAVPEKPDATRSTVFGREVNVDLMQVFMGVWEPYEVPMILEENGLISEDESFDTVMRLEQEDAESVLLPLVRRAFFQHFLAGARVN